jgi:hypothetical protein
LPIEVIVIALCLIENHRPTFKVKSDKCLGSAKSILPLHTAFQVTNPEAILFQLQLCSSTLFDLYIFAEEMADDTRDTNHYGTASATAGPGAPPKKLPRGIVLGKDGKP